MPRISEYNRQVSIPAGTTGAPENPRVAGALGEGVAQIGNSIMKLGAVIGQRVEEQRKEDLHNQSLQIGDQINNDYLDFEVSEKQKLGADAYGSQDRALAWGKEAEKKYIPEGIEPQLVPVIKHHINAKTLSLRSALATHEAAQRNVVTEQTSLETLNTGLKAASLLSGTLEDNIAEYSKAIGSAPGMSDEVKLNKITAGQSAIATARLKSLMVNDPTTAKFMIESGYYDQFIDGKTMETIKPEVDKFLNYQNGRTAGDEIFAQNAPTSMNQPINVDGMRKQIPADLSEGAKAIAEKRIEERARELNAVRTEKVNTYVDNLWQRIDDKQLNLTSALKDIDTADLPGDIRVRQKKEVERFFKPPKDPEVVMMQRIERMEKLADLQEKIANGEVRVKSLQDGLKYVGDVGRENVGKLVSFGKNYEKALAVPSLAAGQFEVVIEELRNSGVTDIPKKGKPEYKAMQSTLLDEIVNKQVATGKILDDAGLKAEFRKVLTTKIPVNSRQTFIGIPLWTTTDEKRQWEVQNPEAVDVTNLLRSNLKREPTKEEIATAKAAYLKKNTRRDTKTRAAIGSSSDY